jgi:TATA-box binding protein (TBP) (component of TFIID and TFIIIB)
MTTRRSATGAITLPPNIQDLELSDLYGDPHLVPIPPSKVGSSKKEQQAVSKDAEYCPAAVSNIVCTSAYGVRMDTNKTFLLFNKQLAPPGAELKSHLIQCMVEGQSVVTQDLYGSGKNVLTGARREEAALLGVALSSYQLCKRMNTWVGPRCHERQNIVCFAGFGFELDLEKLARDWNSCIEPPEAVKKFRPVADKRREWYTAVDDTIGAGDGGALQQQQQPKKQTLSSHRKRDNQGQMLVMRNEEKFKGVQIYWNFPLVMVCFRSGMCVITGTDEEADILSVFHCIDDWEEYKLVRKEQAEQRLRTTLAARRRDVQLDFFDCFRRARDWRGWEIENGGAQAVIARHEQAEGGVKQIVNKPRQWAAYHRQMKKTTMTQKKPLKRQTIHLKL